MAVNNGITENTTDTNSMSDVTDTSESQEEAKTFSQEEVNNMMSKQKANLTRKLTASYVELGSVDELQQLKDDAEQRKQAEQIKRGEFEQTLQDLANKKDEQLSKKDDIIKGYKINTPLINAAATMNAVNPDQVKQLLKDQMRLNDEGEVEVTKDGKVRYQDDGIKFSVENLVTEFLNNNPHFVKPTNATTHTQTNTGTTINEVEDFTKLDMKDPKVRARYSKFRKDKKIA